MYVLLLVKISISDQLMILTEFSADFHNSTSLASACSLPTRGWFLKVDKLDFYGIHKVNFYS